MKLVIFLVSGFVAVSGFGVLAHGTENKCDSGDGVEDATLKKITCFSDGEYANISCNLVAENATSKRLTIVITIIKDILPIVNTFRYKGPPNSQFCFNSCA
jgi:hypothetical protein